MRVAATARWTAEDGPLSSSAGDRDGASRFVRMSAHVLTAIGADRTPEVRWVLGTCHGPHGDAIEAARGDGTSRPFTIPHAVAELRRRLGHRGPVSIVAAGPRTVAMALVEASARIGAGPVVVVFAEESTPSGVRASIHDGLAVAIELVADDDVGPRLSAPRRRADPSMPVSRARSAAVAGSALWPALALVDAVRDAAYGWHVLDPEVARTEARWSIELRPPA